MKLLKQYVEKNFLIDRDIDAYKKKQAGSCLYLINSFAIYEEEPIWRDLATIHVRQYREIGISFFGAPTSFYFKGMYGGVKDSDTFENRLAIHCVAYFRGVERYRELTEHYDDKIWACLFNDAVHNADMCLNHLRGFRKWRKIYNGAIEAEKRVMKEIDRKKQ